LRDGSQTKLLLPVGIPRPFISQCALLVDKSCEKWRLFLPMHTSLPDFPFFLLSAWLEKVYLELSLHLDLRTTWVYQHIFLSPILALHTHFACLHGGILLQSF
jgi:hypothetical protein